MPSPSQASKTDYSGRYDLAPFTNALNNTLNLHTVPELDKTAILREFESQLDTILDAQGIAPDPFNKLIDDKSQVPGSTFEGT